MAKRDRDQAEGRPMPGDDAKVTIGARVGRRMMKVGFLRRRYVKRVIKTIDKSKAKGRRLPDELAELNRFLSRLPKDERAARLEEAIITQNSDEPLSRDQRRAAANQQRRSGKGAGGYRPGTPPRSMQPGPRPPKKPR